MLAGKRNAPSSATQGEVQTRRILPAGLLELEHFRARRHTVDSRLKLFRWPGRLESERFKFSDIGQSPSRIDYTDRLIRTDSTSRPVAMMAPHSRSLRGVKHFSQQEQHRHQMTAGREMMDTYRSCRSCRSCGLIASSEPSPLCFLHDAFGPTGR